jgi:hypothetical protein
MMENKATALDIVCPVCHARPGMPCINQTKLYSNPFTLSRATIKRPHQERTRKAKELR